MEEEIRRLCWELQKTTDPDEMEALGEQLRDAIHEHVESLRLELNALPVIDAIVCYAPSSSV